MQYPQHLIERLGGASAFAEAASDHPDAPRRLSRDAVYVWKHRDHVPYMWRPVVRALDSVQDAAE